MPICFAGDNSTDISQNVAEDNSEFDTNDVVSATGMDDSSLGADDDYTKVYFNASVSGTGNGSKENPYKSIQSISRTISKKTIFYFANGDYSGTRTVYVYADVKFIGESNENTKITLRYIDSYDSDATIFVYNLTLLKTPIVSYGGGPIECEGVIFKNISSTILSTTLGTYGGAIFADNLLKLNNCTFENTNATMGGAIYTEGETIINNTVFKNSIGTEGGAIYASGVLKINNSLFYNNTARGGGAINSVGNLFSIANSNFTLNHATSYGGAVVAKTGSSLTISDCNFINDTSEVSAGAVYFINAVTNIYNSNFTNCSASFGGAICDLNSTTTYNRLKFYLNKGFNGGAILKMYNSTTITQTDFISNTAKNGGALYIDYINLVQMTNLKFENNTADYGGGIYSSFNEDNKLNSSNVSFINNNASFSPQIYKSSYLNLTRTSDNFTVFTTTESSGDIPSKYDMRDYNLLTPVKNQEDEGNCWAFAAIAALESCIMKATGIQYDFSEENMKNIIARFSDYGYVDADANGGGHSYMSIGYLVSWLGPVMDEDDKYSSNALSPVLNAVTHIQNVLWIPRTSYTDNNGIKEAILKYGAVATSINYNDNYLNTRTHAYYYPNSGTNHAVTIVGWDDTYSKSNFKNTPEGDGAFIVRNSWGSSWEDSGYFYVSYYDTSIAPIGNPAATYTFILNDTNRYEKNYQYETGMDGTRYSVNMWIKNRFVAEGDELLAGVSNYFQNNSGWEVSIYVNGELKHTQTGTSTFGYYTAPLTKYIPLKAGDVFEVIYKISFVNMTPMIYVTSVSNKKLIKEGVSFYSTNNGRSWREESSGYVFPIKAFTVNGKLNTTLNVRSIDEWSIGKEYTLNAIVKNQYGELIKNGNVIFSIDGQNYTVSVVNGTANKTAIFNHTGTHNITVLFNETDYYYSSNVTQTIHIDPQDTTLSISLNTTELYAGDSITITAKVNASHGKVNFYINNILNSTVNIDSSGNAVLILKNLSYGSYNITANYTDDENDYKNSSNKTSFAVSKRTISITANDMIISYHDSASLDITVKYNNNALSNFNVNLTINNSTVTKRTNSNGVITIDLSSYECGIYNITVKVNDSVYIGEKNIKVTVNKINANINLKTSNITVGEDLILNITLNSDAKGNVTVTIDNKSYNGSLVNANAIIRIANLTSGVHNITVTYNGDKNYNSTKISTAVTVSKKASNMTIVTNNITYGNNLVLNITVSDKSHGNVTCIINNTKYTAILTDGNAVLTISNLSAGSYSVNITYNGDENHNASSSKVTVSVFKANSSVSARVVNATYNNVANAVGNVTSTANIMKTDKVNVSVYDKNNKLVYSVIKTVQELNNGFNLNLLGAGNYTLNITYNGNANLTGNSTSVKFTVNKAKTNITSSIDNATLKVTGNVINIDTSATVPTQDKVNIAVYDKNNRIVYNENKTLSELAAGFYLNSLDAGEFTLNITYNGNNNFTEGKSGIKFTISKTSTNITATARSTTYNNNVTVEFNLSARNNVNIPSNENISYTVYKNNAVIINEAKITIANSRFYLNNLGAGNYCIVLKYDGNTNFTGSETQLNFTVEKATAEIQINATNVTYNQRISITGNMINLNTTATVPAWEIVNIVIYDKNNKTVYSANKTLQDLKNGFKLDVLGAGNYTLTASYSGSENFTESYTVIGISVYKADTIMILNAENDTYKNPVFVYGNATSNIGSANNGIVIINVYDKSNKMVYSANKTIQELNTGFNITGLGAGNYTVKATYLGNENFTQCSATEKFTVNKANTQITANASNTTYGNKVTFEFKVNNINTSINVPVNEEITYSIYSKNKLITAGNVTISQNKFDINNLSAGEYYALIEYYGNENFTYSNTTVEFKIAKAYAKVTVNATNTTYNNPVNIKGNVTSIVNIPKNGIVIVDVYDINNKSIYVANKTVQDLNNGFSISNPGAGNYTIDLIYTGNENFTQNITSAKFIVNKAKTNITASINSTNLKVIGNINNQDTTATVPVEDNIKVVVYEKNTIVYENNVTISDLKNGFYLNDLNAGNYTLDIIYKT